MTPDERQLIDSLFDRLRGFAGTERDGEAEAYINQLIRQAPYAPYLMAQTAIVNEHALTAANQRVQELEAQIKNQPKSSGSFLGGLFGGGHAAAPAPRQTTVPSYGSPAPRYNPQPASPWGGGQQQPQGYGAPPPQQAAAGGGFLKSAMTTAAGVAGGMILADSIRGMMGGGAHGGMMGGQQQTAAPVGQDQAKIDAADDEAQDAQYEAEETSNDNSGGGWDSGDGGTDV